MPTYTCKLCGFSTKSPLIRQIHQEKAHPKDKPKRPKVIKKYDRKGKLKAIQIGRKIIRLK